MSVKCSCRQYKKTGYCPMRLGYNWCYIKQDNNKDANK